MNNNIVMALTKKKAWYEELKRKAQADADRQIREYDAEIKNIDRAISQINEAVKDILCPACGGSGTTRRMDAAGQMEDWPCPRCKGTGVKM